MKSCYDEKRSYTVKSVCSYQRNKTVILTCLVSISWIKKRKNVNGATTAVRKRQGWLILIEKKTPEIEIDCYLMEGHHEKKSFEPKYFCRIWVNVKFQVCLNYEKEYCLFPLV